MVSFHVSGGILVILCALGGGGLVIFFFKFQEYFGHYLGFRGNLVPFFFFLFGGALVFFGYRVYFGLFVWLRGYCGHFLIYKAILVLFK